MKRHTVKRHTVKRHGWEVAILLVMLSIAAWSMREEEPAPPPAPAAAPSSPEGPLPAEASTPAVPLHPGLSESTPLQRLEACRENLRQLATALEMYATDHQGHYPMQLQQLVPRYLPEFPSCPATARDSYSKGYKLGPSAPYNEQGYQDFYHLACAGKQHLDANVGVSLPAMNAHLGLLPKVAFRGTPEEALLECQDNLKRLATCLEIYAIDHRGHYPTSFDQLSPTYLAEMPCCPVAGQDTYSTTLQVGISAPHNPGDLRDYYVFGCSYRHQGVPPLLYDSTRGLHQP